MTLRRFLVSIVVAFSMVTCTNPQVSQLPPGGYEADGAERSPAAVRDSVKQENLVAYDLAVSLLEKIRYLTTVVPEEGNPRGQLLAHVLNAGKRSLREYPNNPERVYALYSAYRMATASTDVKFLLGREPDRMIPVVKNGKATTVTTSEMFSEMSEVGKALLKEKPEGKTSSRAKMAAYISFLRRLSNQVSSGLVRYSEVLANKEDRTDTEQKILQNAVRNRNIYSAFPGQIAQWSTFVRAKSTNIPDVVSKLEAIKRQAASFVESDTWTELQQFSKNYVEVGSSGDIEGSIADLDTATSINIDIKIMDQILNLIKGQQTDVVNNDDLEMKFPMPELMMVSKYEISPTKRNPAAAAPKTKTPTLIAIGNIPVKYLDGTVKKYLDDASKKPNPAFNATALGMIQVENRVITEIKKIQASEVAGLKAQAKPGSVEVVELKGSHGYDTIYPGLIDLHNHTKQNVLGVWDRANGQFMNRFEWRGYYPAYQKSVSQNMNPWVQFGKPIGCASFRWSEIQAMVVGTTYLQGPSSCVTDFGIQRVEDAKAFRSEKSGVQAPTDLIYPNEMVFVWNDLKPIIQSGKTYGQALVQRINEVCKPAAGSPLTKLTAQNVIEGEGVKILKDQALLKKECGSDPDKLPPKFIRYLYFIHPPTAGKIAYLQKTDSKKSAVIAHLAEGARDDEYNLREYELLKLLGLNLPNLNFVHGVGIHPSNFPEMAKKGMGLIWSPYSNLLLYGETLNIKKAKDAGVTIAIGSDWLPTGSKGVLEEVKLAKKYVEANNIASDFDDEDIFKMMTENSAKLINHAEKSDKESPVGTLAKGAMGTFIATSSIDGNPYVNIVEKVYEKDVNFVVIDGKVTYGNTNYLDQVSYAKGQYEVISDIDKLVERKDVPSEIKPMAGAASAAASEDDDSSGDDAEESAGSKEGQAQLMKIAKIVANQSFSLNGKQKCDFSQGKKGLVFASTTDWDAKMIVQPAVKGGAAAVTEDFSSSKINLDRFSDIFKLLAVNVLTQSINAGMPEGKSDSGFAPKYFTPLYSCNDDYHQDRLKKMAESGVVANPAAKAKLRVAEKLDRGPKIMADWYPNK